MSLSLLSPSSFSSLPPGEVLGGFLVVAASPPSGAWAVQLQPAPVVVVAYGQILRENMTYEIRDLEKQSALDEFESGEAEFDPAQGNGAGGSDMMPTPDRFTNLREALKFFEQLKDTSEQENVEGEEGAAEGVEPEAVVADRGLPPDTLDQQFVDVLTYHEQRQARLREALKNS